MIRIAAVAIALAVCACKQSPDVVARLEAMTSHVERMPRAAGTWQAARVGDGFVIGSAVRTGPASRAKLRVGKNGKLDVNENAIVYFTRTPGRERSDLRVESGVAELETGDDTIGIGEAVLDPNTRARIEASPRGTALVVTVGRATLDDTVVAAGQQITFGQAGAIAKVVSPDAGADAGVEARRDGEISIAVRDKPARIKTATGVTELDIGEHGVEPGAELTVPAGGSIEIQRDGARAVSSGPTKLRVGAKELVHVSAGGVALYGDAGDAVATVPGGSVTAKRGGSASVTVDPKSTAIDIVRGDAAITSPRDSKQLTAGQSAQLTPAGAITMAPSPPARTVVTITAGESPTLHDARAPTPLRIAFDAVCPAGGTVEVDNSRAFKRIVARSAGVGGANVLVPAGTFHYRVRCAGGKGAAGTIRVARESGRTPLPKAAARTTVEMDGRDYTILYQNLLPELTLAWRTAPRAPKFVFVVQPTRGAEKQLASTTPTVKIPAGELREGNYKVWAQAPGIRRSEESAIVIEFDNAAQSASIDAVETAGSTLRVKGTVIEGSTVTSGGKSIDLDRHRRFNTELTPAEGEDGVGVRIAHPKAGIHYYVMRTGPS